MPIPVKAIIILDEEEDVRGRGRSSADLFFINPITIFLAKGLLPSMSAVTIPCPTVSSGNDNFFYGYLASHLLLCICYG